jgi:hypothetical protein
MRSRMGPRATARSENRSPAAVAGLVLWCESGRRRTVIERRLSEWLGLVAGMDCSRPTVKQLQQLRVASRCAQSAGQQTPVSSPAAISAAAELSRTLKPKIQQAADTLGFDAADQAALFAVDYSTHANAWEALQAAAANRAAAAIDNGDRIE